MPNNHVPARGGAIPAAEPLIPDPTRRALLTAIPASAIGLAAISPAARALTAAAEATDEQFIQWEHESDRLLAALERGRKTDEEITAVSEAGLAVERLIFETPSATLVAAQVKLRTLLAWEQAAFDDFVTPLEHILEAIGGTP